MSAADKPAPFSIRRVMVATAVVVSLVIVCYLVTVALSALGPGCGGRRVRTATDMEMIGNVLRVVAEFHYPAFSRMPTNNVLSTSADFVAKLPPDDVLQSWLPYFDEHGLLSTNRGIVDRFGNQFNFIINREASLESNTVAYGIRIWSNGPNGKNENGKGDDWSRSFTVTVDPTHSPQDPAWHPPLL